MGLSTSMAFDLGSVLVLTSSSEGLALSVGRALCKGRAGPEGGLF